MTSVVTSQAEAVPDVAPDAAPPSPSGAVSTRRPAGRVRTAAPAVGWALLGAAVAIAGWQLVAWRVADLPAPGDAARTLQHMLANPFYDRGPNDKGIGRQLLLSLQRVFAGFTLAALVGIPVGLLIGSSKRAWQAVNPLVQLLRPVSPLAWFPIWLVIWKNGGTAAVSVIFVTALWPTVVNTAAGAAAVPRDHRNVARVFRFGRLAYVRHVLLPNTLPSIVTGLRLSMGVAWMVIVAVEMLSGGAGIGFFVWDAYNANNLSLVAAAIILIGVVGVVLDLLFVHIGRIVAIEEVHD